MLARTSPATKFLPSYIALQILLCQLSSYTACLACLSFVASTAPALEGRSVRTATCSALRSISIVLACLAVLVASSGALPRGIFQAFEPSPTMDVVKNAMAGELGQYRKYVPLKAVFKPIWVVE